MPIIPLEIQNQVREVFQDLEGPVKLLVFTQGEGSGLACPTCQDTLHLVEEVASLSNKIETQVVGLVKGAHIAAE